jgi:hypothetical protein
MRFKGATTLSILTHSMKLINITAVSITKNDTTSIMVIKLNIVMLSVAYAECRLC